MSAGRRHPSSPCQELRRPVSRPVPARGMPVVVLDSRSHSHLPSLARRGGNVIGVSEDKYPTVGVRPSARSLSPPRSRSTRAHTENIRRTPSHGRRSWHFYRFSRAPTHGTRLARFGGNFFISWSQKKFHHHDQTVISFSDPDLSFCSCHTPL